MTPVIASHIEIDAEGRARIASANTKVIEIVLDKLAWGWSPEEICLQHRHLSLAQIHAALSYYYDHKDEIDAEIAEQMRQYEELRAQAENSPQRQKLRALGKVNL
jgi:uncharacterized protein (DUF433 family)